MKWITLCSLLVLLSPNWMVAQVATCPPRGDDQYGVNACCTTPPMPAFQIPVIDPNTGLTQTAQWAYIADCGTVVEEEMTINIKMATNPTNFPGNLFGMIVCDDVLFQITATSTDPGSALSFTIGNSLISQDRVDWLLGKYVRTWRAADVEGYDRQFYRFLIAGDANFLGGSQPTQVPPCQSNFTQVMMNGYIDLSCQSYINGTTPLPQNFTASLVLTHYTGCQSHMDIPSNLRKIPFGAPGRHQSESYHLVSPNDFDFGASTNGCFRRPHGRRAGIHKHTLDAITIGEIR